MTDGQSELGREINANDFDRRNGKLIQLVKDSLALHIVANELLMETYQREEQASPQAVGTEPTPSACIRNHQQGDRVSTHRLCSSAVLCEKTSSECVGCDCNLYERNASATDEACAKDGDEDNPPECQDGETTPPDSQEVSRSGEEDSFPPSGPSCLLWVEGTNRMCGLGGPCKVHYVGSLRIAKTDDCELFKPEYVGSVGRAEESDRPGNEELERLAELGNRIAANMIATGRRWQYYDYIWRAYTDAPLADIGDAIKQSPALDHDHETGRVSLIDPPTNE